MDDDLFVHRLDKNIYPVGNIKGDKVAACGFS